MSSSTDTVAAIADVLARSSFGYHDEDLLQAGIAAALTAAGLHPEREVRLTDRDRIDLLVDRVGIEVKVAGTADRLAAQLTRYAASDQLDALLVVTTRRTHRYLPDQLSGKPITVCVLGGAR